MSVHRINGLFGWLGRSTGGKPPTLPLPVALLPLLVSASALFISCSEGPEVPGIEGWTGEPQVAAKIEEARQAVLDEPRSAAAFARLGMIFQAHRLYSQASDCYREALELAPGEPRWPYLAALSIRKLDLEASVGLFEGAVTRGADYPALFVNYGDTLAQLGRAERAAEQYRQALKLDAKTTHALHGLARVAVARGHLEEARGHLERAAVIAPWHGELHSFLAQVYHRLGREEDAAREARVAGAYPESTQTVDPIFHEVEAEAVSTLAYTQRGRRLAREGRFEEAEKQYRKVLEYRPGKAKDYSNLGGTLAGQGRIDEAIGQYKKALEIDPENPSALNNLAMALAEKGELEGAVEQLLRAVEIQPAYPEAHHNLGLVRARQGKHKEAIDHYRESLSYNPSFARAHNDLGTAQAVLGNLDRATEYWRKALEIDPRELSALYNLSVALSKRGEHRHAVGWLRQGIEIAPGSSRLVSLLAWELATAPEADLRNGAEATRLVRRVYDTYPTQPAIGDVMAAALAEEGRFETAIEVAKRAFSQARGSGQTALAAQIQARGSKRISGDGPIGRLLLTKRA